MFGRPCPLLYGKLFVANRSVGKFGGPVHSSRNGRSSGCMMIMLGRLRDGGGCVSPLSSSSIVLQRTSPEPEPESSSIPSSLPLLLSVSIDDAVRDRVGRAVTGTIVVGDALGEAVVALVLMGACEGLAL